MRSIAAALVTGGGRGIGREIALTLSKRQPVLILGRTESDLQSVNSEAPILNFPIQSLVIDIQQPSLPAELDSRLAQLNWHVENLVLNAGVGKGGLLHEISPEQYQEMIGVNVTSSFILCRHLLPGMVERKRGSVVFISSVAAVKSVRRDGVYAAAKAAQIALARSIATDYGEHGIVATAICPGYVESSMTERSIASLSSARNITREEARARIARVSPQNRILSQSEVAETVALVCDPSYRALSGSPIFLTGGGV